MMMLSVDPNDVKAGVLITHGRTVILEDRHQALGPGHLEIAQAIIEEAERFDANVRVRRIWCDYKHGNIHITACVFHSMEERHADVLAGVVETALEEAADGLCPVAKVTPRRSRPASDNFFYDAEMYYRLEA